MRLVEEKITVEFDMAERDTLANWILRELGNNIGVSMSMEVYDILKGLGRLLAPEWD
jgi:hypothetical protein